MKIFPVQQIAKIDQFTIQHEPIDSIDLMERASSAFYKRFSLLYPHGEVCVLVGPGNNGGDALAVARMLINEGRKVNVMMIVPEDKLSSDGQVNYQRLLKCNCTGHVLTSEAQFNLLESHKVIIDGLFGSGLNRPLSGLAQKLVVYVNSVDVDVVSIDIPSGLFGEDNRSNDLDSIVMADYTISFQFPKLAFLQAENELYVGEWLVEDIGLHPWIIDQTESEYTFIKEKDIKDILKDRSKFSHKGHFGHALLMAGSYGKMGAAILASRACLKTGVGLLITHVPRMGYSIIQTAVPEAMANIDRSDILVSEFPDLDTFSAIGIGPGIDTKPNTQSVVKELLCSVEGKPLVLDADAINILAMDEDVLKCLPEQTILTPHPGEFDRLVGDSNSSYERLQKAQQFARDAKVIIVLKGAYTAVIDSSGKCSFNSTGNAGMASAGSGDVLTGMILSLLSQGYQPYEAACLGVYLHGLSADLLLNESSEESIVAGDIISNIGAAFKHLRR